MATVELKEHIGHKRLPNGQLLPISFNQDYVILQEVAYNGHGTPEVQRIIAGYCDRTPGASFRPIVGGLPESIMTSIKKALAERDAAWTGKPVDETYDRHICKPPPAIGEGEDEAVNQHEEYEDDDDERDDDVSE